jgi:allantoin racemase
MRLMLINPNTNAATTEAMRLIAQGVAPTGVFIDAKTAPFGAPLITSPVALRESAQAVLALIAEGVEQGQAGVIIAAFGDPALGEARRLLPVPVTGIAEAGMAEAAAGGRRFAVVTTTPELVHSIASSAEAYGYENTFLGTELTEGNANRLTNDPVELPKALLTACQRAITLRGAEAIVIGGGPLALAARAISGEVAVPIIEPVPAAVRLALSRVQQEVS